MAAASKEEDPINPAYVPSDEALRAIVRNIEANFPPGAPEDEVRLAIAKGAWQLAIKWTRRKSDRKIWVKGILSGPTEDARRQILAEGWEVESEDEEHIYFIRKIAT